MNWKDAIGQLMVLVQETAPALWQIARRQVWSQVAVNALWAVVMLAAAVGLTVFAVKAHRRSMHDMKHTSYSTDPLDWSIWAYTSAIFAGIFALVLLIFLSDITVRLINPDYYAVKALMDLLPK